MASSERCAVQLVVSGIVQGVGYRFWTERVCRELKLSGWVRNLRDSRVQIRAEGTPEAIQRLLARCREGPPASDVEGIEQEYVPVKDFVSFDIRPTASIEDDWE